MATERFVLGKERGKEDRNRDTHIYGGRQRIEKRRKATGSRKAKEGSQHGLKMNSAVGSLTIS